VARAAALKTSEAAYRALIVAIDAADAEAVADAAEAAANDLYSWSGDAEVKAVVAAASKAAKAAKGVADSTAEVYAVVAAVAAEAAAAYAAAKAQRHPVL
jgi:hypothetical protein